MSQRGHLGTLLAIGLLAIPVSTKHADFQLFSQETEAVSAPLDSAAWDALRQGICDKDAQHRKTAFASIGTIGDDPEAVKLVVSGLQDKDSEVRQTAAATLGEMGAHDAIPNLKAALDDTPEVSFTAAKALWDLGDSNSRDIIQAVIKGERKDAPGRIQGAMHQAKEKMHNPAELAYMGAKEATGVVFAPASIGIVAIHEAMKESKNDAGAPGRAEAAVILGKDPDPYSLILLEWGLSDKSSAVRVAVAKALGQRGNEQTIAKLSPLLADQRHSVRYMAAASMLKLSLKKNPGNAGNLEIRGHDGQASGPLQP
jgi:HEAT repeat protein